MVQYVQNPYSPEFSGRCYAAGGVTYLAGEVRYPMAVLGAVFLCGSSIVVLTLLLAGVVGLVTGSATGLGGSPVLVPAVLLGVPPGVDLYFRSDARYQRKNLAEFLAKVAECSVGRDKE